MDNIKYINVDIFKNELNSIVVFIFLKYFIRVRKFFLYFLYLFVFFGLFIYKNVFRYKLCKFYLYKCKNLKKKYR